MIKQLKTVRTITGLLSWFCLYFAVLACVLCFLDDRPRQIITALIMLIPFAVTILLCMRVRYMLVYVAWHLGLAAVIWLLCRLTSVIDPATAAVLTVACVLQMILFFYKRIHYRGGGDFLRLSPVLAVIFFILWIIANGMELDTMPALVAVSACVYMLASVLGIYLTNMIGYIDSNRDMANMPVQALIRSGNGQITIFMLLAFTAILVLTNIGLDRLLRQLQSLLLAGVRFLFSLAPNNTETVTQAPETSAPVTTTDVPEFNAGEPSEIMVAVSDVFMTIVQIAMIIGAAALIIYGVWQLWQRFNGIRFQKKNRRDAAPETEDIIEKISAPEKKRAFWFRSGMPEDKIRRIYYKKIQSGHKKDAVPPHMTPEELTGSIRPADAGAAQEFTRIYEQARYSGRPPQTDAAAYKALSRKL